ncbi:MAG: response regulator [Candidatus Omnitrophota bacterium]
MKAILIVDDEKELIGYLSMFIERKGFKALTASTGEKGIELYKENLPICVFLDLHLPKMDGITVLKKIKEINPDPCVYLVTGDDSPELRQKGEQLGIKGYLLKPLDIRIIIKILDDLKKEGV